MPGKHFRRCSETWGEQILKFSCAVAAHKTWCDLHFVLNVSWRVKQRCYLYVSLYCWFCACVQGYLQRWADPHYSTGGSNTQRTVWLYQQRQRITGMLARQHDELYFQEKISFANVSSIRKCPWHVCKRIVPQFWLAEHHWPDVF